MILGTQHPKIMIDDSLFRLHENISIMDIKDGLEERFAQVGALLNYILTNLSHGQTIVNNETIFDTLRLVDRLFDEIKLLNNQLVELR